METFDFTMDLGFAPESLFETDQAFVDGPFSTESISQGEAFNESFNDFEFDLSSESMSSFLEMEQIPEVKADPQKNRPSVIMAKPKKIMKAEPVLTNIMSDCGILNDLSSELLIKDGSKSNIGSPSSIGTDMEMERNQELIDELEEFFIKVEGKPTVVEEQSEPVSLPVKSSSDQILSALTSGNVMENNNNTLTMEDLNNAYTTSIVSENGENVIIIISPSSPADFDSVMDPVSPSSEFQSPTSPSINNDSDNSYDTDPEWTPSVSSKTILPVELTSTPQQTKQRKKYARSKPPQPPTGPYPTEKKERKKAQNRTAAFRYREKKKSEQEMIDDELELLTTKNGILKDKLTEMETEFRYLKKLMTEAGLGRYAQTVHL